MGADASPLSPCGTLTRAQRNMVHAFKDGLSREEAAERFAVSVAEVDQAIRKVLLGSWLMTPPATPDIGTVIESRRHDRTGR